MNVWYYLVCLQCFSIGALALMFGAFGGGFDLNPLKCMWRREYYCPHEDIKFHLYTPKLRRGKMVDILKPSSFLNVGYRAYHETALIIHGFNGTQNSKHIKYLIDAYVHRDYNVVAIDWERVSAYPCYLSSLSNTRLVAQCTAQLYSFLTYMGQMSDDIVCVGHSLGAHICGMVSNHLTKKQYKIIGLDPASPIVESHFPPSFRLTRDDAEVVQIIHTNAGFLGQTAATGTIDFCINGGRHQPYCHGHALRRARCAHFLSVCYLANSMFKHKTWVGVPCPNGCVSSTKFPYFLSPLNGSPYGEGIPMRGYKIGQDTPDNHTGVYCIKVDHAKNCPFQ